MLNIPSYIWYKHTYYCFIILLFLWISPTEPNTWLLLTVGLTGWCPQVMAGQSGGFKLWLGRSWTNQHGHLSGGTFGNLVPFLYTTFLTLSGDTRGWQFIPHNGGIACIYSAYMQRDGCSKFHWGEHGSLYTQTVHIWVYIESYRGLCLHYFGFICVCLSIVFKIIPA